MRGAVGFAAVLCFAVAACVATAERATAADGVLRMPLHRGYSASREHRHPSRRQLQQPTEEVPIFGNFRELAYYYADVFVGTPPQRFTVIADTGSTLLAFPCKGCSSCGAHMDPKFDVSASSTVHSVACAGNHCSTCTHNQCGYRQSYAEGSSLVGVYYKDLTWLGGVSSNIDEGHQFGVQYKFGCHSSETNLFKTQKADGIMGLSQSADSLVSTLAASGKLAQHTFSMCLSLDGEGTFALGGYDASIHQAPIQWAALTSSRSFYTVTVTGATFNDGSTTLSISHFNTGSKTIVDSGTSFTYLPKSTFDQVHTSVSTFCARAGNCVGHTVSIAYESLCYRLSRPSDLSTFPSMELRLSGASGGGDVVVKMPANKLFINMDWDEGSYCLGVYSNGNQGGVIGANAMIDYDVVFDVTGRRVGFAPSTCTYHDHTAASPSATVSPAASPSPAAPPSSAAAASPSSPAAASPSAPAAATTSGMPQASSSPAAAPSVAAVPSSSQQPADVHSALEDVLHNAAEQLPDDGKHGSASDFMAGLVAGLVAFVVLVAVGVAVVVVGRRNVNLRFVELRRMEQPLERVVRSEVNNPMSTVSFSDVQVGDDSEADDAPLARAPRHVVV